MTSSSHPRRRRSFIIVTVNAILFTLLASLLGTSRPAYAELPPETYVQGTQPTLTATSSLFPAIDDGIATTLPIGFPFTFYGTAYTQFALSSNGFLSFDTLTDPALGNITLPNAGAPNNLIAAFWDDLDGTSTNGKIFYTTTGTAPNRRLVVQWTNTGFFSQTTPLGTFQIILYEGSNEIQVQYRYLVAQDGLAHGNSATVGIEDAAGTAAVLHSFNTVGLTSGQAIRFTPNGATYDRNPAAAYDGIVLGAGATASPAYPQQLCPANHDTWSATPTFYWADSGAGVTYRLIVDSNSTFSAPVIDQAGLTTTSYTPGTALTDATTYYWAVVASNANDETWSEQWSFTTNAFMSNPPCAPQLVAPNHQATGVSTTPTCSWQAVTGVTGYRLVVSPNADLTSPVYNQVVNTVPTSQVVSGLVANTLYYWRVSAMNANGTTPSMVRSFTTASLPTATTIAATSVSASDATLNATVKANNTSTTVSFQLTAISGDYTSATNLTATPATVTGTSATAVSAPATGLLPATTYYYRVVATNSVGTTNGNELSFSTASVPPTVTTIAATSIITDSATLNATVKANNTSTTVSFQLTAISGDYTSATNLTATPATVTGTSATAVSAPATGLLPATTYYYRVVATNSAGTTNGNELSFSTAPNVITLWRKYLPLLIW